MLNWKCGKVFRTLGNALAGKSSPVNPGQTRNRSLVLESLEQRQLLSVVPWQADGETLAACVSQPLEAMRETERVDFCSFGDMSLTLDDEIAENEALSAAPMLSEFQGSLENGNELFSSGCGCGCGCEPQEWYNVGVSTTSNTITEGGTQNITFTRDNTTDSLTVYFTYSVSSWYAGDARYGVDYTLSQTGSVAFADGSSTTSITLSTIDDTLIENNEILYISLTQPSSGNSNYSINNSSSSVSMTIMDNDEWQVSVTPSISQIEESAGYGCGCGSGDPQYGEFTLSRTGQTDPLGSTPGTTVFFQMSGTATLGSDYNISREYYYEYLNYGTNGVYAVDFPTTGSVKIRVNPYNDGVQESDKTVQLTVLTPEAAAEILFPDSGCGCGCGCGNEYDNHPYRYTPGSSSSGTVTIRDDDWWKVGVATTDDTATERLYDVEQDYGEFTFTRTHLHPTDSTVEGDTTYGITVEFDMIYDSANPNSATNSAAQPGSDYALQYQSGDSWYSASQISSTTTGTVTRYRYSVTIPYEETTLKVRLNPNFDWNDEGVLFDFSQAAQANQTTQTPDDDQGENANLEITNVTWGGKLATWDALDSANDTGQIEIKDGAICLIRTDSNNDGSLTLADDAANDVSGSVGRLLMMNNDDDNGSNTVDSTERPNDFNTAKNRTGGNSVTVTGENDLAETFVYAWIDSLTPATGTTLIEADVYLSGSTNLIAWTQATKGQHLHYGEYDYETYPYRMKYETTLGTLTSSELSYSRTFYVEADTQNWAYSGEISANVSVFNSYGYGMSKYDSVRYTPINVDANVDLRVDSNNDGDPVDEEDNRYESDDQYAGFIVPYGTEHDYTVSKSHLNVTFENVVKDISDEYWVRLCQTTESGAVLQVLGTYQLDSPGLFTYDSSNKTYTFNNLDLRAEPSSEGKSSYEAWVRLELHSSNPNPSFTNPQAPSSNGIALTVDDPATLQVQSDNVSSTLCGYDMVKMTATLFVMEHDKTFVVNDAKYAGMSETGLASERENRWICDLVEGTYETPATGGAKVFDDNGNPTDNPNQQKHGDNYLRSALSYADTGFTMNMAYDFILSYATNNPYGYIQPASVAQQKMSFVGNGGIKLGSSDGFGDGVFEVAIFDFQNMINKLVNEFNLRNSDGTINWPGFNEYIEINPTTGIATLGVPAKDENGEIILDNKGNPVYLYERENIACLLNLVGYGQAYCDMPRLYDPDKTAYSKADHIDALRIAYGLTSTSSNVTIIAEPGVGNTYNSVCVKDEDCEGHEGLVHFESSEFHPKAAPTSSTTISRGDGHVYLQAHWGSGVMYTIKTLREGGEQ